MEELNDNQTIYDKGIVLLKNALKKYEDGDIEGGDKDRKLANELFDKSNETEEVVIDDTKLYGENRNFGIICNIIMENAKTSYNDKDKFKSVGKILRHIKNNKLLKEQFNAYSFLETTKIQNDSESYVNEALSMLPKLNKKEVFNENNQIIKMIRDNKLDEFIEINEERLKLYEAIEFMLLNQKNISNIDSFKTNSNIIKEYVEKNNKVSINENTVTDVNENKEDITEDEKKLLKELNEGNKEEVFNKYKNDTINMISSQISLSENINDKLDWNNMMTRMLMKQYDEDRILEDICDFIKIQNVINE